MAQAVRAFQTPDKNILRVDQMARASIFDGGVGIFDERNRMIAWIETSNETQSERTSDLLLEIINNPRRAKQPDWSYLNDDSAVSAPTVTSARTAVMPTRPSSGTGNSGAGNSGTAT